MTETLAPALWQLPDQELTTILLACEEKQRAAYAETLAVIGEIEQRGLGKTVILTGLLGSLAKPARAPATRPHRICATKPNARVANARR